MLFGIKEYIFTIGIIVICILFLISDALLTTILVPFSSYWKIFVREDGLYGLHFWEFKKWWFKKPRKICDWEDIDKIKRKGLINIGVYRVIVFLRENKKITITNIGHSPAEISKYHSANDEYEKIVRYSNRMLYALIMKRIGIGYFESFRGLFKGKILDEIITSFTVTDSIIEVDKKYLIELAEKKKQWEKEEEEERRNGNYISKAFLDTEAIERKKYIDSFYKKFDK
jgi:hypothetical protein